MNFINRIINNNYIFFSVIIILFTALNIIFYFLFIQKYPNFIDLNGNLVISQLTHSYADIMNNLINENKYYSSFFDFDVDFYVGRLPFIPFFLYFLTSFISKKYLIILLSKNLILFSLLLFFMKKVIRNNFYIMFALLLILIVPFNIQNFLMIVPEEGYINYLVVSLFLVFISDVRYRVNYITFLLVCLFFIKGSFCFFIYTISIYFLIFEKNKTPLLAIFICYVIWSSYAYIKTDRVISPISLVSIGGVTLSSANNDKFNNIYPLTTPDVLYDYVLDKHRDNYKSLKNEFDIDDYFKNYNINYILNNKKEFALANLKKLNVIFFNIKKDGQYPGEKGYNQIRYSNIFNILCLNMTIFLIAINFFKNNFRLKEIFFVIFFPSYIFPFMVGFVYTRHIVPIYLISILYLFFEIGKPKLKSIYEKFN